MSKRWKAALVAVLLLGGGVVADTGREPEDQLSTRLALAGIGAYRRFVSPWVGSVGVECRFFPSCSRYAEVAIRSDGVLVGSWRVAKRLARCGPWTPASARMTARPVPLRSRQFSYPSTITARTTAPSYQ